MPAEEPCGGALRLGRDKRADASYATFSSSTEGDAHKVDGTRLNKRDNNNGVGLPAGKDNVCRQSPGALQSEGGLLGVFIH